MGKFFEEGIEAMELAALQKDSINWQEAQAKFERLLALDKDSSEFLVAYREVERLIEMGMMMERREG
ncbi:MAG: hypothetical protein ACOYD6_07530 [Limnochordia bacterium]|jgi:hypothetical protein